MRLSDGVGDAELWEGARCKIHWRLRQPAEQYPKELTGRWPQITDAERAAVLRGSRFRSVQAVGAGGQRTRKAVAVFRKYFYARDFLPVPRGARTLAKGNAQ